MSHFWAFYFALGLMWLPLVLTKKYFLYILHPISDRTPMRDHPVTTEGAVFHHRDHCNDNCLCYRYRCWLCCYVVNLTWRNKCFPIDGKDTAGSQTCRLLSLNKSMSNSQYFKIVITWYSAFHWKSNEEKSIFSICNYMLSTLPCKFNVEKSILSLL